MSATSCVEELCGVRGCALVGSSTEVSGGRRLQRFELRYYGPVPLFVTEPDREDEAVDEFIDPRSGTKLNAETGEMI